MSNFMFGTKYLGNNGLTIDVCCKATKGMNMAVPQKKFISMLGFGDCSVFDSPKFVPLQNETGEVWHLISAPRFNYGNWGMESVRPWLQRGHPCLDTGQGMPFECWDGVFQLVMGVPQNGWFIIENRIKMDDLGVPLFQETSRCRIRIWWIFGFLSGLAPCLCRLGSFDRGAQTQGDTAWHKKQDERSPWGNYPAGFMKR